MKKTFLKFGLFLVLGLAGVVFYSCDDDDDEDGGKGNDALKITATNVANSSSEIATVKMLLFWHDANEEYQDELITQAVYKDNGFVLELPTVVTSANIPSIVNAFDSGDLKFLTISDKQAKLGEFIIAACNAEGTEIGDFCYGEHEEEGWDANYVYVDRDVTITGEEKGSNYVDTINLDYKKGWNIVYYKDETRKDKDGKEIYYSTQTTQKPSDVKLSWRFYSDED